MIRPPVVLVIILVGLSRYFQTGSCENSELEDRIEILSAELGIPEWKVRKFLNVMNQQQSGNVRIIRSKYFKVNLGSQETKIILGRNFYLFLMTHPFSS